ncbi:hypothetical protein FNF29_02149 [Cafeteria roenbergensis]|uniref:Uncharacterized protein n=1 Tax=Cafeteria roenbergensis TaxID=33653 RepID=A0A5A8CPN1_CAFRO|nr:hypothetical protein FNF29_02149 [Cafeteria roenbergensis]|eukprot:KAA0155006.1 hypothetical protein FNF29_02149 [Cafeteria roenbergensis]
MLRAAKRILRKQYRDIAETWRYHRHRDDPLFEPTPKPAQRKPKPGQPVSLEALPQLGDAEANEAASIRSEAWWAALADLVKLDTHWARGVSLPEARDQAKSLEREEALLLARALSRSRGESLSREELAAFAESMVTTSAERARSLARRLWEASSEDRSKEIVRAYTETAGEALEAFILAFEQAKRREVRMYLREHPGALDEAKLAAAVAGSGLEGADLEAALLQTAKSDAEEASARLLRAPSTADVRAALANTDSVAQAAQAGAAGAAGGAAAWLQRAADAAAAEATAAGAGSEAAATARRLAEWASDAAASARAAEDSVRSAAVSEHVTRARTLAEGAISAAEQTADEGVQGVRTRSQGVAEDLLREGQERSKRAGTAARSAYGQMRSAFVSGDVSQLRQAAEEAALKSKSRLQGAADRASSVVTAALELDLADEELEERDARRKADAAAKLQAHQERAEQPQGSISALAAGAARRRIRKALADEPAPGRGTSKPGRDSEDNS